MTETGIERRAQQVAIRMRSSKTKTEDYVVPGEKAKKTPKISRAPSTILRVRSESSVPDPSPSTRLRTSASNTNLRSPDALGHNETIFLEDIAQYEAFLTDPRRTEFLLLSTRVHLRALALREKGLLISLSQQLEDRRDMVNRLVRRFDQAVEDVNRPSSSATTLEMVDRQGNLIARPGMLGKSGKAAEVEGEDDDVEAEGNTNDEDEDRMKE